MYVTHTIDSAHSMVNRPQCSVCENFLLMVGSGAEDNTISRISTSNGTNRYDENR